MLTLVAAVLVVGVASAVQAISGFGFALLAVPLLAFVTPVRSAVVVGTLTALVLTTTASIRERAHVDRRTAGVMLGTAVLGMPVGLLLLVGLPGPALTVLVGLTVLGSTLLVWRRIALPATTPVRAGIGVLVGVLTTATGTNGPPLVAALTSMGYAPRAFRATVAAVFSGCGIAGVLLFLAAGQIDQRSWLLTLCATPAVVAGWLAGDRLFQRIDAGRFRRVVLVSLIVASIATLVRAITP